VDALLHEPEHGWAPTATPRALRATTLRELPLGDLLARVRRRVAADWRSGIMAPRTLVISSEGPPAEKPAPPPPELLAQRRELAHERDELEKQTWELLTRVRLRGGYDDELIRQRDELSRRFKELDEKEKPEQERQRELRRQLDEVQEQLDKLLDEKVAEESLQDGVYAARFTELSRRQRELEAKLAGREDLAELISSQRSVFLDAERFIKLTQEATSSFTTPGQKAGRPPHYSLAQLELVAKTYRDAYRSGSNSPTKDVAAKLGMSRSRAAKLIMRCRDPRVGLLAPTAKRKAGETTPPHHGDDTDTKASRQ